MITRIKVLPRIAIEHMLKSNESFLSPKTMPWHLISIFSVPAEQLLTPENRAVLTKLGMRQYLSLCFGDIVYLDMFEKYRHNYPEDMRLFDETDARKIIDFLNHRIHDDKCVEPELLVVHCDAGISRSGAVGEFANGLFGLAWDTFVRDNPGMCPNFVIRNCLLKVLDNDHNANPGN